MTAALAAILVAGALFSGTLTGAAGLAAACCFLLSGAGAASGPAGGMLAAGLLLAVPAAAYLAGAFLERFCEIRSKSGLLRRAAAVLALALICGSPRLTDCLFAAAQAAAGGDWRQQAALAAALGSGIVYCAGVAAFCLMIVVLLCEIPLRWFGTVSGSRLQIAFAGMRPLAVVLLAAAAFNLVSDLYARQLSPQRIAAAAQTGAAVGDGHGSH